MTTVEGDKLGLVNERKQRNYAYVIILFCITEENEFCEWPPLLKKRPVWKAFTMKTSSRYLGHEQIAERKYFSKKKKVLVKLV